MNYSSNWGTNFAKDSKQYPDTEHLLLYLGQYQLEILESSSDLPPLFTIKSEFLFILDLVIHYIFDNPWPLTNFMG